MLPKKVLPLRVLGNEKDIWLGIVTKAGDLAEVQARTDWSAEVKATSLQFKVPKFSLAASKATIDRDVLTQGLQGAAGPNPHWSNNPQVWAPEFAKKAANAIADAIEKTSKDSGPSQEDIKKHFLEPLTTFLSECTSAIAKAIRTVNMSNGTLLQKWAKSPCHWRGGLFNYWLIRFRTISQPV